jgi:hypothetical protein
MGRLYKGEIVPAIGAILKGRAPLPPLLHPLRSSLLVILEALMQVEEVALDSTEVREGAKVHCRNILITSSSHVILSVASRHDHKGEIQGRERPELIAFASRDVFGRFSAIQRDSLSAPYQVVDWV